MEKDTTYVALDDSKRKIVAGILRPSDVQPELREIANDARQIRRLFERLKREGPVAACYEAGVSGYDLYRQITELAVSCQVMAPALTPRRPGQRIKTDRRDAGKLVHLFRVPGGRWSRSSACSARGPNIMRPATTSSRPTSTMPPPHMARRMTRGLMLGSSGIHGSFVPQDGHTVASRATSVAHSRQATVSAPLLRSCDNSVDGLVVV